jgi:hypothetical protein
VFDQWVFDSDGQRSADAFDDPGSRWVSFQAGPTPPNAWAFPTATALYLATPDWGSHPECWPQGSDGSGRPWGWWPWEW